MPAAFLPPDWQRALRAQRGRAVSTLLGLVWGTFGIVAMLAFGTGLREKLERESDALGRGIVIAFPQRTSISYRGYPAGRPVPLRLEDVRALPAQVPGLEAASPEFIRWESVAVGDRLLRTNVSGVDPSFGLLRSMPPQPGGRFLDRPDLDGARRVAFLGERICQALFDTQDAVGRGFTLNGAPFTVVGVQRPKKQMGDYGGMDDMRVTIPASSFQQVFGDRLLEDFVFRARDGADTAQVIAAVYAALGPRAGFDPRDRQALNIWDTTEGQKIRTYAFLAMDLLLGSAGAFTLLVGAIGLGNLMFVLVQQRRREIGIQMAVGARPSWILREYLAQALVLVLAGGALGFLLAWGVTEAVAASPLVESVGRPRVSLPIGALTVLLLAGAGTAAGYFPARRAARLDPVEALAS